MNQEPNLVIEGNLYIKKSKNKKTRNFIDNSIFDLFHIFGSLSILLQPSGMSSSNVNKCPNATHAEIINKV